MSSAITRMMNTTTQTARRAAVVARRSLLQANSDFPRCFSGGFSPYESNKERPAPSLAATVDCLSHRSTYSSFSRLNLRSFSTTPTDEDSDTRLQETSTAEEEEEPNTIEYQEEGHMDEYDREEEFSAFQHERDLPQDHVQRVYLDRQEPFADKVQRFIDVPAGKLHPLDRIYKIADFLKECGEMRTVPAMNMAECLLERLIQEKRATQEVGYTGQPYHMSERPYDIVLYGWTNLLVRADAPLDMVKTRMERLILLMERESKHDMAVHQAQAFGSEEEQKLISCEPTTNQFNTMLRGYALATKRYAIEAPRQAEILFQRMIEFHKTKGWHCKPNTKSYTHVMWAQANARKFESGRLARRVLNEMIRVHKEEKALYLAEYGEPYDVQHPEKNKHRIVTPDVHCYTAVITAYANSGARGAAGEAERTLKEMCTRGIRPDAAAAVPTIVAWANKAATHTNPGERFEAASHAEDLLWQLVKLLEGIAADGGAELTTSPDEVTADESVDDEKEPHFDEDRDALQRSKQERRSSQPTVAMFNACMAAWAKSDVKESAPRAEALLQHMIETCLADDTAVKPDVISFNTVINAWARYDKYDSEAPRKAEELLDLMYNLSLSGRLKDAKPNASTYDHVMMAWARSSKDADRTRQTRRLLDTMLQKYDSGEYDMKPGKYSYSAVLNAAAFSPPSSVMSETADNETYFASATDNEEDDSYTIALETFKEFKEDPRGLGVFPDHVAYASMLKIVAKHTDDTSVERRQMLERFFDEACEGGFVSAQVIRALRQACPTTDLLERLLQSRELAKYMAGIDDLPKKWTRRVGKNRNFRIVDGKRNQGKEGGEHKRVVKSWFRSNN